MHPLVHGGRRDLSRLAGDEENAELNAMGTEVVKLDDGDGDVCCL